MVWKEGEEKGNEGGGGNSEAEVHKDGGREGGSGRREGGFSDKADK